MKKVYDNDNDNDDYVQGTNFDQKSSLEPTGSGELKTLAKIPEEQVGVSNWDTWLAEMS